jgi:hypothetical protein
MILLYALATLGALCALAWTVSIVQDFILRWKSTYAARRERENIVQYIYDQAYEAGNDSAVFCRLAEAIENKKHCD